MKYDAKNMYYSCLRKAKFTNEAEAQKRADKYGQRVYYCRLCGYYHLTKKGMDKKYD